MAKRENYHHTTNEHYEARKEGRFVQIWMKATGTEPAAPKGEKGAVPVHRLKIVERAKFRLLPTRESGSIT